MDEDGTVRDDLDGIIAAVEEGLRLCAAGSLQRPTLEDINAQIRA
jgi:hypothetical protein